MILGNGIYQTKIGGSSSKAIDMVWVIDNSGSMDTEAGHVRSNFSRFIESLNANADIRVALISKAGSSGTAVSLPVSGSRYLQINYGIGSTDGLALTASALCPTSGAGPACSGLPVSALRGNLRNFLRADSHKIFVFVTDDNSFFSADSFQSVFRETYPNDLAVIFGFVGKSVAESPCIARPGTVYVDLAQRSGGSVFNICDSDWTNTFDQLATNVINVANGLASLPQEVLNAQNRTVYVDGVEVPATSYTIDKQGIHFDASVLAGKVEYVLRIEYN